MTPLRLSLPEIAESILPPILTAAGYRPEEYDMLGLAGDVYAYDAFSGAHLLRCSAEDFWSAVHDRRAVGMASDHVRAGGPAA